MISGDFNSRISDTQPCDELFAPEKYLENINTLSFFDSNCNENITRHSQDNTINMFGKSFIEFIAGFNLTVLNGIFKKNNDSSFTYMSPTGNSVIDYFLVSDSLFDCTDKMLILNRTESFHFPISLTLKLDDIQCVQNKIKQESSTNTDYGFLKWENEKRDEFIFECSQNNLRSYLQRLENDIHINVDNCISKFCDFFMNASTMMKKSPKGNKSLK